ncbi:hypothetical protein [Streptomyces sp. NPDC048192]|jgi:hypothetical protein|uniref:hypothetical protein n=1 Tax=Streptomyces sp. NPDC048192 TaxID=3365510 RepID=UPI00371A26AB
MRRGLPAVAVLTVVTVAGCGGAPRPDLVVKGTAPASPYRGPLYVKTRQTDASGPRALRLASGAAGRALECDGEIFAGSGPDGWSEREGGRTPKDGLRLFFDMVQPELPDHGWRAERRAGDRVLYSYDVGGRTKAAVVVAKDQKNRPGWGPETNASCDPAEFPAAFAAAQGWEVWTDRHGRRVPVSTLTSSAGPEHCGWQSARFLDLDGATYARDPDGVLGEELLTAPYRGRVRMPADARDTGYRYRDRRLWLTPDRATAYVRTSAGVEAWPRLKQGVGCE